MGHEIEIADPRTPSRSEKAINSISSPSSHHFSDSSYSSSSTANTTGTAVHHKSIDSYGVKMARERGLHRENGRILTRPSNLTLNDGMTVEDKYPDTESRNHDANRSPLTDVETSELDSRHLSVQSQADLLPDDRVRLQLMRPISTASKGYTSGQYVTNLATEQQDREIHEGMQALKARKRSWWKRLCGIGK